MTSVLWLLWALTGGALVHGVRPDSRSLQQPAGEHRRKRQRNEAGNQDCHANGDRKLAEQAAQNSAHKQDGNKDRNQRNSH